MQNLSPVLCLLSIMPICSIISHYHTLDYPEPLFLIQFYDILIKIPAAGHLPAIEMNSFGPHLFPAGGVGQVVYGQYVLELSSAHVVLLAMWTSVCTWTLKVVDLNT